MLRVDRHRQEPDPNLARAHLAVAHRRQVVAEVLGSGADRLLGRVERQTADEQDVAPVVLDHARIEPELDFERKFVFHFSNRNEERNECPTDCCRNSSTSNC